MKVVHSLAAALLLVLLSATSAMADSVSASTWYEFAFGGVGSQATGCSPADPSGPACIPSSGTPTSNAPAAPWTFTGAANFVVTDAFLSGDRFEIFDFGTSLGLTSSPTVGSDCGDDPVVCLANPNMSSGAFLLAAGNHSITITSTASVTGGGAGYFQIQEATSQVPEPGTMLLLGSGIATVIRRKRADK